MQDFAAAFSHAFALILSGDADLLQIIGLSLQVTISAVFVSCVLGLPLGAFLAVARFPGRQLIVILTNAAMGFPPVVVGLMLYLLFSQAGPLAVLDLLYTPTAMIVAQTVLVTPIITALTRSAITDLMQEHGETLLAMRASKWQQITTLLVEARPALMTAALAGLGRAFAEVGAVMIVGGNISHVTRVMTTAIALETSRGELALALALGIILLGLSLLINAAAIGLRPRMLGHVHAR
ncbi:tungstate transport system permease protein [Cognatiyoonia koreensis]|uniref:Tungstate transport system permease protein n=1 Tax=Cognatiyoonia koreensis TaxID=364200 RepID=A0A1I0PH22_9RHOB|nr:ABC transporter permease [Cognatiyoonia koreensis]SEW13000.1 tungstate transport system permease protein [Cognatiyoonia koreensis]